MSFLKKFFKAQMPTLSKNDIEDIEKVRQLVSWFIQNDPNVSVVSSRSSNIIFNENIKPHFEQDGNPDDFVSNIESLSEWFVTKIFIDLGKLKDASKEEFVQFIDSLCDLSHNFLISAGEVGEKYNLSFEGFIYENEINKIPNGKERERFKENFLKDNVISAEMRILGWLYHEYFDDWYRLKEDR